jgi:hypothetical protein
MVSYRYPIISDQNFIIATRDAGYRNLATALAELLDNSIQAGSTCVRIFVDAEASPCSQIAVLDDGRGMDAAALRTALQFGGSSRFNDRSGQGRFGMGLPNSSFSQARRFEVYTWQNSGLALFSYLDIDDVAAGKLRNIPRPEAQPLPRWAVSYAHRSGTLVVWQKCDRVPAVERIALLQYLRTNFARMYRYHLWDGINIFINDETVPSIDPLLCDSRTKHKGAAEFGGPLVYDMRVPREPKRCAQIRVRFAEFPVAKWHSLSSAEKRSWGISRQAGVSIVRGKREVAFGWFFMGKKRKENYDDWWRCEVTFDPDLDEYFGVTNTKQQISPVAELEEVLGRDVEPIARMLNARARSAFNKVRTNTRASRVAVARDRLLPPAGDSEDGSRGGLYVQRAFHGGGLRYKIEETASSDDEFYSFRLSRRELTVVLNTNHPFYRHMFCNNSVSMNEQRFHWECLLFALARSEAEAKNEREIDYCRRKRIRWSNALATFLGN